MTHDDLLELVRTNPDLTPEENEFGLHFSKVDSHAHLYTEIASLVRRAISHSEINVEEIMVRDDNGRVENLEFTDEVTADDIDGIIVAVKATLPIGLVKIQSNPRKQNNFAPTISPQTPPSEDAFD